MGTDRYHAVVASEESQCPRAARVAPHAPSVEEVTVQTTLDSPLAEAPADAALGEWIVHEAVGCLVEGRFAEIHAILEPPSEVAEVRLYFSSELSKGKVDYWTEMTRSGNRFTGRLPKPQAAASPIHYRIEARRVDGRLATTDRYAAVVVPEESGCPAAARVAPRAASTEPVTVY